MNRRLGSRSAGRWVAAIVWLSLTPSPPQVDIEQGDKLGHFLAYGLLMFWFCQLYAAGARASLCAAGFVAMGVGLEFVQGALGYRTFERLRHAREHARRAARLGRGARSCRRSQPRA